MTPEFVESESDLDFLCNELQKESAIAVDTEFARERTYYPHIGLLQLAGGSHIACIDPLAFDAMPRLRQLLLDTSITKVFHSCQQDLEVLELTLGEIPCPVFDTQIAEALMTEDHQISYARLVEQELDIQLSKSETRTNWLKRPLTKAQLEYAADDVRFLLALYQKQSGVLEKLNRSQWLSEECNRFCTQSFSAQTDFSQCWTRVKGKQRLQGVELAIVQDIAAWREQQAMASDRPRRRVLPDDLVIQIAIRQPSNSSELVRIGRLDKLLNMSEIDSLSETINHAYDKPESEWPSNKRLKLSFEQSNSLKAILDLLGKTAADLGISQGMLCNRKDAEKLVHGKRDLPVLTGWRLDVIGKNLLGLLP